MALISRIAASVLPLSIFFLLTRCVGKDGLNVFSQEDKRMLLHMIEERERAMVRRDLAAVMDQFYDSATFINGGGYYYEGIAEIRDFHQGMFQNDSLSYTYKIGKPLVSPVKADVALVYYPWQQDWTLSAVVSDTLHETGLMTLLAVKENGKWKWRAITNQRTKTFFPDLTRHKAP